MFWEFFLQLSNVLLCFCFMIMIVNKHYFFTTCFIFLDRGRVGRICPGENLSEVIFLGRFCAGWFGPGRFCPTFHFDITFNVLNVGKKSQEKKSQEKSHNMNQRQIHKIIHYQNTYFAIHLMTQSTFHWLLHVIQEIDVFVATDWCISSQGLFWRDKEEIFTYAVTMIVVCL